MKMLNHLIRISSTVSNLKRLKGTSLFVFLLLGLSLNALSQTLTIGSAGDTGSSGTNWTTSGSSPVKIIFTGTASINKSVIEGLLATDNVAIEAGTGGQAISITAAISSTSTNTLTVGSATNTNAVTISGAISTAAPLVIQGGLITISSNLATSNSSAISLFAKSGLRFGNAGITLQTQGGDVILSSDYDANNSGNIISDGALTINSNGGAILLGGGVNAREFAYGMGTSSSILNDQTTGIWIRGAVSFNSGNGDISIRGYAANASPTVINVPVWGVGLGTGSLISGSASVSLDSGTGKILIEGWARNPSGSNSNSSGVIFNGWDQNGTQPLTITSANTASDAIQILGNTENTINGQRYKNGLRFFSNASSITATGIGGGITLTGKTFDGNDHPQIAWGGGNILAVSGPITINSEKEAVFLEGDLYLGSKSGTAITSSSSPIQFSIDDYSVASGKLTRIATTGAVVIEAFGNSFTDYTAAPDQVVGLSTATGWSFNENNQTMSSLIIGKSTSTSNLTLGTATTIAGPVSLYGTDITVSGAISTTTLGSDVLIKSKGSAIISADIKTNGGDITLWTDADANGTGGVRVDDNSDFDSRTQTDRTANTHTTGGGNIILAGGLDDAGVASGTSSLTTNLVSADGYPDGYAVNSGSTITQTGIVLGTSTAATGHNSNITIFSGGGDVRLHGLASNNSTNAGNGPTGLLFFHGYNINAGTNGNVVLLGNANLTSGSWGIGLDFAAWRDGSAYTANGLVKTTNGNIDVISRANGGSSGNLAIAIDGMGNNRNIFAATGSGNITIKGLATGTNPLDVRLTNVDLLASTGNISVVGEGTTGTSISSTGWSIGDGLFLGQKTGSLVTSATGNILLRTNVLNTAAKPISFNTSGTVTIEPFSTSFGSAQTISNVTFANTITALNLGKSGNTAGITLGSAATIAGPVTFYGGALAVNAALTATNNTINLNSNGAVTQSAAITASNLNLAGIGTFTLTNTSNNIATIAGGDNSTLLGSVSFTDASGGLTIGTVSSTVGLTSSGTILVETLVGDLTLAGNVSTTNTTSNAIFLNAGKSSAIGTTSGGNILVSGTPTVSTGTGGIAKLFSGSDAGSTGLTTLVGGVSNTRNGADETSSNYSPSLGARGIFALYRTALSTVTPSITSFSPSTAGNGETVVITGSGFTGVTIVKFGNVVATSFTVDSDTQISAVVGAAASGDVYVQNPSGNNSKTGFLFKVVELKFEGNVLDQTAAHRDGVVSGTLTYGAGASGQAICFTSPNVNSSSAVPNYLTLPSDLIRGRGTNFTISLRFKTTSFGAILGYQNAGVKNPSGGYYVPILYVQSDGKLSANLWQGFGPLNVLSANRVDDGNWHKVEFSAAPGSITVYIDGVLAGTSNGTIDHLTMSFNQLGAANTAGVWTGDPIDGWFGFNGCIDEFIIIDKSLTATQIQQVTQLPLPTITSFTPTSAMSGEMVTITGTNLGSTSNLKFGGVDARSFTIISATEVRAIVPSAATLNTTVLLTTAAGTTSATNFTFDCSNNALDFDGSNDHAVIGDQIESLGAFSQEAWVYWKGSSTDYSEIFTKETVSAFAITNTNKLHANFGNGSSWGAGVNSTTSIPLNKWTHVAVTRSASGLVKLYINGVLDASTATLALTGQNTNSRVIGGKLVGSTLYGSFKGAIDELKAWNSERTAQQILAGMGSEQVGNETGLIAYYNFNQGIAGGSNTAITTVQNLTPTANLNATLTNIAKTGASSNFVAGVWPVVITQPAPTSTVCAGTVATLTATAVGPQLTYQWYTNSSASTTGGTAITGATAATYTFTTSTIGSGYYYVIVSGTCSQTTTSTVAEVITTGAPVAPVVQSQTDYCVQPSVTAYKYAKVVFSNTKTFNAANSIQVAEWKWFNGANEVSRTGVTVTNPGGSNPGGEEPQNIYDGSTYSKWLDFNIKSGNNTASLIFTFPGTGPTLTGYSFVTANDSEERDPRSWIVYMSNDNVNWTQVHTVSNYAAPSGRYTASTSWTFASGSAPTALTATALANHTLKWYSAATGGTGGSMAPSLNTSTAGTYTYYVSQTNAAGCESPRATLAVTVNALPAAPITANVNYATGATASALTATALANHTLQWYTVSTGATATTTAPIPSTSSAGTVTYYVSQVNTATGCEGPRASIAVVTASAGPAGLTYTAPASNYVIGTAITPIIPTSSGGSILSYSISPTLPAGLVFNTSTGAISGTPTEALAQTTFTITATNVGGSTSATVTLTVDKRNPTISTTANLVKMFGDPSFTLTAPSSTSTGAFTFSSSNPAIVSISGSTATIVGAGTVTITITQAADATYNAGSVSIAVSVAKSNVSLSGFGAITKKKGDAPFIIVAPVTSSTGAFTYLSSDPAVVSIIGNQVTIIGVGTAVITATQVANANYEGGTISTTITVTKESPALSGFGPFDKTTSDAPFNLVAPLSPSSGAVTYTSSNPAVATIVGNQVTIVGVGTAIITANQAADANYEAASITAILTVIIGDSDGDGVPDNTEIAEGTNPADPLSYKDLDGDRVPDFVELADGTNPNDATKFIDSDQGGVPNYVESILFSNLGLAVTNPDVASDDQQDSDGDGVPNYLELLAKTDPKDASSVIDTDGDGVPDYVETRQGTSPTNVSDAKDSDGDGVPDYIEIYQGTNPNSASSFGDVDGDGYSDVAEGYSRIVGSNIPDTDGDGTPDYRDVDSDGDGILDINEDNLNLGALPDCDGDGVSNRLDRDVCVTFTPQGISPNGDGENDVLLVPGVMAIQPNRLTVYDRAGIVVFEKNNYQNDWAGTNQSGVALPDGVYYYIVDFFGAKPTVNTFVYINRLAQ
jgi:gliding motility-associated-like protein